SLIAGLLLGSALSAGAQTTRHAPSDTNQTFFTRGDLVTSAAILGISGVVSVFDERIAHWTQTPSVQGSRSRKDLADNLTFVNETPLTIAAVATYGIGRLSGSE